MGCNLFSIRCRPRRCCPPYALRRYGPNQMRDYRRDYYRPRPSRARRSRGYRIF